MSIDAAVGRIDQILSLRQQILDPASLAAAGGSSAATTTAGTSAGSGSGMSTSFASALASAQGVPGGNSAFPTTATTAATGATGASGGQAISPSDSRITAMTDQANSLIGKPYVWGGGHSGWGPQTGYDCSGFVSAVLHAGGYLSSPQDTQTLPSQPDIQSGPGQYVTIYDRTDAGGSDHVIISVNGQFYESGGESGSWGGGGGVAKIGTPSAAYLATFNDVLHPAGL